MLTVRRLSDLEREKAGMGSLIADRRLYLTADGATVVEESDPRAALLLAGAGCEIDMPTVQRLRLSLVDGKVMQDVPVIEDKEAAKPEDKQAARPRESKAKGGR